MEKERRTQEGKTRHSQAGPLSALHCSGAQAQRDLAGASIAPGSAFLRCTPQRRSPRTRRMGDEKEQDEDRASFAKIQPPPPFPLSLSLSPSLLSFE